MAFPLYSVTNFLEYTGLRTTEQTVVVKIYLLPLAFIAQTATIWVTVLVAFNRYIAVCKPFKAARLCTVVQVRQLYPVYTMKLARRTGSTSARRALDELARRALDEPARRASFIV